MQYIFGRKTKLAIAFLTASTLANAGDGGAIRVVNDTSTRLDVTFSGDGCFRLYNELTAVCGAGVMNAHSVLRHDYGWGVWTTWLNVGNFPPGQLKDPHPCSPGYMDSKRPKKCIFDHMVVDTDAGETDVCIITRPKNLAYHINCYRE